MKIDVIIPAAGFSSRFPSNKLLYRLQGKMVIEHVLDVVEQLPFHAIYVVTQYAEIEELVKKRGAICVWNKQADKGMSASLLAGLKHCQEAEAVMFLNADMPYIQKETLLAMMKLVSKRHIVCAKQGERVQNPMIFPKCYLAELLQLAGDHGAKQVALAHAQDCRYVSIREEEARDIDCVEDVIEKV